MKLKKYIQRKELKMRFPESKVIEALREKYPAGCRVKLTKMDDVQAPPIGTFGTVDCVD